jgi:hypothetical protein
MAYETANAHAKLVYEQLLEQWRQEVEQCAKDPSYAPKTDARSMSAEEASYFAKVMEGIYFSYLCRKKNCMFFGGNNVETWIKEIKGYRFRCPLCGYKHSPWKTGSEDVPAKRVLTITSPLTGEVMHIPTENPVSEDEKWINNMIEATAQKIENEGDAQQWFMKAAGNGEQRLAREGACREWRKFLYEPRQRQAFVLESAWDTSRQKKNGYLLGLKLTDIDDARQPFSDFNGLISVFANYVAASRALTSRM